MIKHFEVLLKAYTRLEDITPLKYDCGELCGALCCHDNGNDGETLGMWLLPFERELLEALTKDDGITEYTYGKAEDGTETVFCNGRCDRRWRPFACRIYPFYPLILKDNDGRTRIKVRRDPRARFSCPIAMKDSYLRPDIEFVAAVKSAVRELLKDEEIAKDLISMSDFLYEIEEMQEKLIGD